MGAVSPVVLGFVVFQQEAVHLLKILVMSSLYRDAFELSGQNADGCLDAIDVVIENDLLFLRIDVDMYEVCCILPHRKSTLVQRKPWAFTHARLSVSYFCLAPPYFKHLVINFNLIS